MARLFLWSSLLAAMLGAYQLTGICLALAAASAVGWLLFGTGGRWL